MRLVGVQSGQESPKEFTCVFARQNQNLQNDLKICVEMLYFTCVKMQVYHQCNTIC